MKVVIITDFVLGQYYGGGEKRYYEIWKRLIKKGYTVDVYCMKSEKRAVKFPEGVRIFYIGPNIKNPPNRSLFQLLYFVMASFIKLLFKSYDVYEAQGVGIISLFLLKVFGKKNTVKLIHDLSSGDKDQWISNGRISEIFEKMIYRLPVQKTLTVTNNIKDRLINEYGISKNNIFVVHNGVDDILIDSVPEGEKKGIIFVGRLIPHKHVGDLIKVVNKLPDINLNIIGKGVESKKLKDLTLNLGISKRVNFLGTVADFKNVVKYIKSSKLLVLPSTREGFGLVLVEAMYSGTPVVAYESDGANEVIDHNINGVLVKQNDTNQMLVSIKKVLNEDNFRNSLVKNGKIKVRKSYLWNISVNALINVYKR